MAHDESQTIIHATLTENKDEDYDYDEEENSCRPANVPHFQEAFEFFLQ